jgi:hypothetical protein
MTIAATMSAPIFRTCNGEPPLGHRGEFFLPEQGEMFDFDARYSVPATRLGVLALDSGAWLASPPSFHVGRRQYPSREAALRAAIAGMVRRARKYMRAKDGEGTQWTDGHAGRVIAWALALKPKKARGLLTSTGNAPRGAGDRWFFSGDGEWYTPDDEGLRHIEAQLGLVELDNGRWLAHPDGLCLDYLSFPDRVTALRSAIAKLIRRQRMLMRRKDLPIMLRSDRRRDVISWALSLKAMDGRVKPGHDEAEDSAAGPDVWMHVADDAEQLTRDPVVRMLVEAHRARRQFPAKHVFSMTNPIADGRIMIRATCGCGHVISFGANDQLRVDAAIEAHWRRYGEGPSIDGRGIPIKPGDGARISGSKQKVSGAPVAAGIDNGRIELNAEDGAANSPAKTPRKRRKADALPKDDDDVGSRTPPARNPAHQERATEADATTGVGTDASASMFLSSDEPCPVLSTSVATQTACDEGGSNDSPPVRRMSDNNGSLAFGPGISRCEDDASPGPSEANAAAQICAGDEFSSPEMADGEESAVAGAPTNPVRPDDGLHAGQIAPVTNPALADNFDADDLVIDWPSYDQFLEDKIITAPLRGIEVPRDALHPYLKPHCKDLVVWSLRLGCAAIFASFGLHKTAMQLEWCRQLTRHTGQPTSTWCRSASATASLQGSAQLGMDVRFIRTTAEVDDLYCEGVRHFLTNYESIREGKLDVKASSRPSLDEASVLRSYGSKTFQEFLPLFVAVPFKLVATATPSPNRYKELIHYAGFLGVMDTGQALTRFFQRNSEKAGDLTLYPHKEDEFWLWVHSWAIFLQKPSELGHSDDGYELPPLKCAGTRCRPIIPRRAGARRAGRDVPQRRAVERAGRGQGKRDSLPRASAR